MSDIIRSFVSLLISKHFNFPQLTQYTKIYLEVIAFLNIIKDNILMNREEIYNFGIGLFPEEIYYNKCVQLLEFMYFTDISSAIFDHKEF